MGVTDRSSPETLAFDSDTLPKAERVDRYRALYGYGADILPTGPTPRMAFEGWRLDAALLYHRRLNDIAHCRTPERVAHDGLTHWTATLLLEGRLIVDWGHGLHEIKPGELVMMHVARPTSNEARQARIVTFSIAERRLADVIGPLEGLHGLILAPRDCRLYADFVRSLLANLPTLSTQSLPSATSAMCTLLKVALDAHGHRDPSPEPGREGARLARLRMLVDARLGDPQFDADSVIAESGLSRATLYRMLRPHHGLARYIQVRRLEHLRRALSDPHDTRPLAAMSVAYGFATESSASKLFLAQYGLRPGKYRSAVTHNPQEVDPIEQFQSWQEDLN